MAGAQPPLPAGADVHRSAGQNPAGPLQSAGLDVAELVPKSPPVKHPLGPLPLRHGWVGQDDVRALRAELLDTARNRDRVQCLLVADAAHTLAQVARTLDAPIAIRSRL